jgi:hypothetical protein
VQFFIYDNAHRNREVVLTMDTLTSQITYKFFSAHNAPIFSGLNAPTTGGKPLKGYFLHDYMGPMTPSSIPMQQGEIRIVAIEPDTIIAREPTTITVRAEDSARGTPVDGEVIIDGAGTVGRTNTPFTHTFNTQLRVVTGRVTAQGYADAELRFRLTLPQLEVRAEPSTIEINRVTQVTIYAADPRTHEAVAGQVITNEAIGRILRPVNIGNTDEQITHTFVAARGEPELADIEVIGFHPAYPIVTVVAPGYSDTAVPIDFTGQLPSELLPPPFTPRRVSPDIEDGDDCPRPGRCPDEQRDGPEPFDLP